MCTVVLGEVETTWKASYIQEVLRSLEDLWQTPLGSMSQLG